MGAKTKVQIERSPSLALVHQSSDDPETVIKEIQLVKTAADNVSNFYKKEHPPMEINFQYSQSDDVNPDSYGTYEYHPRLSYVNLLNLADEARIRKAQAERGRFPWDYQEWMAHKRPELVENIESWAAHRFAVVVEHEIVHLFNRRYFPELRQQAYWVDEGMARYISWRSLGGDNISSLEQLTEEAWKPEARKAFEMGFVDFSTPNNFFDYKVWNEVTQDFMKDMTKSYNHYVLAHLFMTYLPDAMGEDKNVALKYDYGDAFAGWKEWLGVKS